MTSTKRYKGGAVGRRGLGGNQHEALLETLEGRFESNMARHRGIHWAKVRARLEANAEKLWSLSEMERTGGEPDVIDQDKKTSQYLFCDCASESPKGRRSVCYDRQAREARKKHKPDNSAVEMAAEMGVELLTEGEYRRLQQLGEFDTTTSSWLLTPPDIRDRGGAIFGDLRFGRVFIYHNGAESYYAARGFRCSLWV
jgi:hypothetical protein